MAYPSGDSPETAGLLRGSDHPLTPDEAAALLGLTLDDVLAAAGRGEIPANRIGPVVRFSAATLTRYRDLW